MKVVRTLGFDMGHRVPRHSSKCRNVHGHRYFLEVGLEGDLVTKETTDEGMVMDFSHIKSIAESWINETLDHGYMGHEELDAPLLKLLDEEGLKNTKVAFIPTAENIARFIFDSLAPQFHDQYGTGLKLSQIKLWETPNCFVIYSPPPVYPF